MLDPTTGNFSTDDGFVAGRRTLETTFLLTAKGKTSSHHTYTTGKSHHVLPRPQLALSRPWVVTLYFSSGRLSAVSLTLMENNSTDWADWSETSELALKQTHDQILVGILGQPPYRYPWGEVSSTYDPRSGSASISVRYS
jgi:hypothetical protein